MTYHHLTQEERYQIYAFRKANFSIRQIAAQLDRDPSTVSRELRRNVHRRGYRPKMAHYLAVARAQQVRSRVRITADQWLIFIRRVSTAHGARLSSVPLKRT